MDINKMSTEQILAELNKRGEATDSDKTDKDVLIFGSIGNNSGANFVEIFREIKSPDDLQFLSNYSLRTRFNSHRDIKGFYFKSSEFKSLKKSMDENNETFADWVRQNKNIKFVQL